MKDDAPSPPLVAIVGAGPAGLMAAEALAAADGGGAFRVHVFDAMPSVGRKFLMAGKSGLNLTHAEPFEAFLGRFGAARERLEPALRAFGPAAVRDWAEGLGIETFAGSSGRVFPTDFKAAPLLRAWLRRLRAAEVQIHVRHRWVGWSREGDTLVFETPPREQEAAARVEVAADAAVLALGGASWPRLGSDAAWVPLLRARGVAVMRLRPANCGFDVAGGWSETFRERFAGAPVKAVALTGPDGQRTRGEFVITGTGIEGSAVYAHSAALRDAIEANGNAVLTLDLAPDRDAARLARDLAGPRGGRSLSNHLRRAAGIEGAKAGLLRECVPAEALAALDAGGLAAAIKGLTLRLSAPRPIEEAISSAGGVALDELDEGWMLRNLPPGTFCAGEMLDWEVPTGGYLLTACLALGRAAGLGAAAWLGRREREREV